MSEGSGRMRRRDEETSSDSDGTASEGEYSTPSSGPDTTPDSGRKRHKKSPTSRRKKLSPSSSPPKDSPPPVPSGVKFPPRVPAPVPPPAPAGLRFPPPQVDAKQGPVGNPVKKAGGGLAIRLGGPSTTKKETAALKRPVASVFNNESSEEEEEMPPEAKMRMKNVGRETITSSGPNSFGKTKQGFCDTKKLFEKNLRAEMEKVEGLD